MRHTKPRAMYEEGYELSGLRLRVLQSEDAEVMYQAWTGCPEATKYMAWKTHVVVSDTEALIRKIGKLREEGTAWIYGIELADSGEFIGHAGFAKDEADWKYKFGYILGKRYWGRGYATLIAKAMAEIVFSNPQAYRLSACVDIDNKASMRVLEKAGFEREGILSSWELNPNVSDKPRDVVSYARVR